MVAVATPASLPALAAAPAAVDVRVAQAKDFSRIEFRWKGRAKASTRLQGRVLTLRFNRDASPDLAQLRYAPPRWLKSAEARRAGGALEVALTLADDAEAKVGEADGATFVNLFAKPPAPPEAAKPAEESGPNAPVAARPSPVPAGGVVRVRGEQVGVQTRLHFDWKAPAGAAVFRRGEALWIVFDAAANLDISKLDKGLPNFTQPRSLRGAGWSALRLAVKSNTPVAAIGEGSSWTITFGPGDAPTADPVDIARDDQGGLTATLAGATAAVWVDDPVVGDRFVAVTALGPAKAFRTRRDLVDMRIGATVHGLFIAPRADDLQVAAAGDLVHISGASGLTLSPRSAESKRVFTTLDSPQPAAMPGLIGDDWGRTSGPGGFLRRYAGLLSNVATEEAAGRNAPVAARMALARFLIGCELSYEAIGVLNDVARDHPELTGDAEFRGLRGMARVMAGRFKEAESDFSIAILADDPSASLWRGYIAAQSGAYADAHQKFIAGGPALRLLPATWRAKIQRAEAQALLGLGDATAANDRIGLALAEKTSQQDELESRLVQARAIEALGRRPQALAIYQALARSPVEEVAAPALLNATRIQYETGAIKPAEAADLYNSLRFRWRGDATELETIRALGQLYLSQGRYRDALEALRSAGQRLPDLPQAVQLQNDLAASFRALFLEGQADGLQPIQALALFYDFKEMTPVGADGDLIVRKLVRRLVDVDLLDQAADLLKYQVDNRLDGLPKAQVATDLATIYLMDRRPEEALVAINGSRTTVLPPALNTQRRLLQARAFSALGRLDAAQEILESDKSPEARAVKAEIAWKGRAWPIAGGLYEAGLGDRWRNPSPLSADEEARLLRAGVAYSLAADDAALDRLRGRYQGFFDRARNPDALRIAYAGVNDNGAPSPGLIRVAADDQTFAGWVNKMKQRFRETAAAPGRNATTKG